MIRPILIDREMPKLQARLDELNKIDDAHKKDASAPALSADQQKEFIVVTSELKLLDDRRQQILARVGDEYVTDPPKLVTKP